MRLVIAVVGRLKQGPERELFEHYLARADMLGRKRGLSPLTLLEIPESRASTATMRRQTEADALLAKLSPAYTRFALDPGGEQLGSEAFAATLGTLRDGGAEGLAFLIGGADGLGSAALAAPAKRLSLGPMTLPHGLARIVLAEQLYRAATILAGHPYHRG
jgi:23S rRNA (pseudouridine1915-N3)-methyltransferase